MMVITFATIGYGEPQPLTPEGRIFTILLIISGFTTGFYAIGKLSSFLLEGELTKLLKLKRMFCRQECHSPEFTKSLISLKKTCSIGFGYSGVIAVSATGNKI